MKKKWFYILVACCCLAITGCSASGADIISHATASALGPRRRRRSPWRALRQVSTGDLAQMALITLSGNTASAEGEGVTSTAPP